MDWFATRKRAGALIIVFGLSTSACGCSRHAGGANQSGQANVLRYPLQMEPSTLDPTKNEAADTSDALNNIYEGLVNLDRDNKVIPGVADRWDISKDGQTITFHLNPRVRFHKPYDRQVTAADVKYSLERVFWPETKSPIWPNVLVDIVGVKEVQEGKKRDISGVVALDSQTLAISLIHPCGYYPYVLSGGFIVCREAIEKSGGNIDEKASIGTGPYVLKSYRSNNRISLEANPDYWGGRPKLDGIERPVVLDEQTGHVKYENGEVDICQPSQPDFDADLQKPAMKGQTVLQPTAGVNYLVMHPKLLPAFRDIRVRRAFAMAIDKDEIIRVAYRGLSKRADCFLAPGVLGFNPAVRKIPYDPAAARKLLAEAGFAGGAGFPKLTLVYAQKRAANSATAQIVRDNLKQNLGIQIDLQEREAATFYADTDKEVLPFYYLGWFAAEPHDYLSLLLRTGAKYNTLGYSDPAFDKLCDEGDRELDPAKRASLYSRADQLAMDDVAVIPTDYRSQPFLVKPYVKDLQFNLSGLMPHYTTRIQR